MFYSRPNLPKLGIDLVKLEGGGMAPSQFEGKTADGRPIYIRYRGGYFSVQLGKPGQSVYEGEEILAADFGPGLHGAMLLEQACDLAGITINGSKPVLTLERWREASEEAAYLDFSGRSTYWIRDLSMSRQAGECLLERFKQRFPNLLMLEGSLVLIERKSPSIYDLLPFMSPPKPMYQRRFRIREDMAGQVGGINFGIDPDMSAVNKLLKQEHVYLWQIDDAFRHKIYLNLSHNKDFGAPLASGLRAQLTTRIETDDAEGRKFIAGVIKDVEACCGPLPAVG